MNELIHIEPRRIGEGEVQTVNARDLHAFLGIGKDFSTWIKAQIARARLAPDRDYLLTQKLPQKGERENQALGQWKTVIDYHLTLDAAKHIAMVSGTDKGFEVREYFLDCERRARPALDPMRVLNDPVAMRHILLGYTERVIALEGKVAEQAPKVAALDRLSEVDGARNITDTAKYLQLNPKKLFIWLHKHRWIYRRAGGNGDWVAYQERMDAGLLVHKVSWRVPEDGEPIPQWQALVTIKGATKLAELLSGLDPDLKPATPH